MLIERSFDSLPINMLMVRVQPLSKAPVIPRMDVSDLALFYQEAGEEGV